MQHKEKFLIAFQGKFQKSFCQSPRRSCTLSWHTVIKQLALGCAIRSSSLLMSGHSCFQFVIAQLIFWEIELCAIFELVYSKETDISLNCLMLWVLGSLTEGGRQKLDAVHQIHSFFAGSHIIVTCRWWAWAPCLPSILFWASGKKNIIFVGHSWVAFSFFPPPPPS